MNRGDVSNLIRSLGLSNTADFVRFQVFRAKNRQRNRNFKRNNPSIGLPPDYLLYESFAVNHAAYYDGGKVAARDLHKLLVKYKPQKKLTILDWGCGPGRIIRHMPDLFEKSCQIYGTDYNLKNIEWCKENLQNIKFSQNSITPPLDFPDQKFDIIYGISIITHLSEKMHYAWIAELHRVLRNDGIIMLTTAGNAFSIKLTNKEKSRFANGELIVRGNVKEGHRTFSAFHPVSFMHNLFSNFEIVEHIVKEPDKNHIPQEIWIIKK